MRTTPLLCFLLGGMVSLLGEERPSYSEVMLDFGVGWSMLINSDGSAEVRCGSIDSIRVPSGTFDFGLWSRECLRSVRGAKSLSIDGSRSGTYVALVEPGESRGKTVSGVLTPELKRYLDGMFSRSVSERMKEVTNQNPVFSPLMLDGLEKWTNSDLSRVPLDELVVATPPKHQVNPAVTSPISRALEEHRLASASTVLVDPAGAANGILPTRRGWLVSALFVVGLLLAYRLFKLRSGGN
jgi:hypothetical protein